MELLPFVSQICSRTRQRRLPWGKIWLNLTLFRKVVENIYFLLQNSIKHPNSDFPADQLISLGDFTSSTGHAESILAGFIRWMRWEKKSPKRSFLWKKNRKIKMFYEWNLKILWAYQCEITSCFIVWKEPRGRRRICTRSNTRTNPSDLYNLRLVVWRERERKKSD